MFNRLFGPVLGAALLGVSSLAANVSAAETLPGSGKSIQPISTGHTDQSLQNEVVQIGLERLWTE